MIECQTCPVTSLPTIAYNACRLIFGKDAKFIFQRLDDANNSFLTASNGIQLEASWSAPPSAGDGTHVTITPTLEDVNWPEPDKLESGENLDGAPINVGPGPQLVTAIIRNPTVAEKVALDAISCEQALTVYRVDNKGNFGCRLIGADHAGIKVSANTFSVKGPFKDGSGRVDQNKLMIEFYLPADWFNSFAKVVPASGFDPLNEITP